MRILLIIFSVFFVVGCGDSKKDSVPKKKESVKNKDTSAEAETYESLVEERVILLTRLANILESVKDENSADDAIEDLKNYNEKTKILDLRTKKLKERLGKISDEEMNKIMEQYIDEMNSLASRIQSVILVLLETEYGRRVLDAMSYQTNN